MSMPAPGVRARKRSKRASKRARAASRSPGITSEDSPEVPPGDVREQWYPLVHDPVLRDAGVEVGARALFSPGGPPLLRILFRAGGTEASVECVHVILNENLPDPWMPGWGGD